MGVTSIRLNPEVEAPLKERSQKLDRSKNYIINQAIREFIARQAMEDERCADTLVALSSVQAGEIIDAKEVTAWLESWGSPNENNPPKV
ncbi:MAG: CopG family ribbon-helix-helix protein [Pseudomonadales bacterium]